MTAPACASIAEQRRYRRASVALASVLLVGALGGPFLLGWVYTFDDLGAFHLPIRAFYATCLAQGDRFDWLPHLYNGVYLTGEGQAGTYHPAHWLLYRWLPLETAWGCELLLSYPAMFAGMYCWLCRRFRRREAALFGSLVFTFSGFNLLHFAHVNAIAVVAHVPWLLWAIDVVLRDANKRRVHWAEVAIALLTGSQLLLGYPQYVWFSLLAEGTYAALLLPTCGSPGWGLLRLGLAKTLGVAIGGVQLLPTVEALAGAARGGATSRYAYWGSLPPANVVQLVAPFLSATRVIGQNTHELGLYFGAVPLLLVVWLLTPRREPGRARRLGWIAAACGLAALLLAFGQFGPLYRLQTWLPLVGSFRFPCRAIVLVQFCLAIAAACALLDLVRREEQGKVATWRQLRPLAAVVAMAWLVPLYAWLAWPREQLSSVVLAATGPLLISLGALAVVALARHWRGAFTALVALTALDLGIYGLSYGVYRGAMPLEDYLQRTKIPPGERAERYAGDLTPFDDPGLRWGNQAMLAGRRRVDGYLGLEPRRVLDYRELSALQLACTRWLRSMARIETASSASRLNEVAGWLEVPAPLPRARLVCESRVSRDPAADLGALPLATTALVERPLALSGDMAGDVESFAERPGELSLVVDAPGRQLLVVADSYHSGWRAFVDGEPVDALRVNGDFLGCVVPAGRHAVTFAFRPRSLQLGWPLSLLGLAGTTWIFARNRFHHR